MVIGSSVNDAWGERQNKSMKLHLFLRLLVVQVEWFSIALQEKKVIILFLY